MVTMVAAAEFATASELLLGGPKNDRGVTVSTTADGGFIIVGVTESRGSGGEDVYLVRLDAEAKVVWESAFGGARDDDGWSVVETASGGFVVAGFSDSSGGGGFDCTLTSTDSTGNPQWSRHYGGAELDRCWSMAATSGGWVVAGETASSGSGERDCYLVRTDDAGNELWSRTYGGTKDDRCFSVAAAKDGGFVLAGQTFSEGAGDRDAWILKTDARGELEWSATRGGTASDVAHSVVVDHNGNILVIGYTTSFAETPDDPMLLKYTGDGKLEWSRVLAMDGHNKTITGSLASGGGLCVTGVSTEGHPSTNAALILKVDGSGQVLWTARVLPTSVGETFGYGVTATADGGCAITGHTTRDSAGRFDLFFARVDSGGEAVEGKPLED
jgi:hypothetical protein